MDYPHTFYCYKYFVIGGIRSCIEVSSDPIFQWISSNSCPLNLLLVRSPPSRDNHRKAFIHGFNNMTSVWVKPRSCNQVCCKNDAFTFSTTITGKLTNEITVVKLKLFNCMQSNTFCISSTKRLTIFFSKGREQGQQKEDSVSLLYLGPRGAISSRALK